MKARGATVPFSAGWVEIYWKRERRAEKRVGGAEGMGGTTGKGTTVIVGVSIDWPEVDGFRSGLRRTGARGRGGDGLVGVDGGGGRS